MNETMEVIDTEATRRMAINFPRLAKREQAHRTIARAQDWIGRINGASVNGEITDLQHAQATEELHAVIAEQRDVIQSNPIVK